MKKKSNQKSLTENFVKYFQDQEGIFSTSDIESLASYVIPRTSFSIFVGFPGEMCQLRAFYYALTKNTNSFEINKKDFLAGASKFGLDSPFPFVAKRIGTFGNEFKVDEILQPYIDKFNEKEVESQIGMYQ
jgi:hypothetical protein